MFVYKPRDFEFGCAGEQRSISLIGGDSIKAKQTESQGWDSGTLAPVPITASYIHLYFTTRCVCMCVFALARWLYPFHYVHAFL